jgi:hypothetical protein
LRDACRLHMSLLQEKLLHVALSERLGQSE